MQEFGKIPKKAENAARGLLYEFADFRLNPQKRIVLRAGEPLALTPKCFDLLLVLVERHNEVMVKEELMEMVWPDTAVEEGNLNRHISTLRKVLGESPNDHRFIVTVPGRGYRFVAEVREVLEEPPAAIRHEGRARSEGALQPVPGPEIVKSASRGKKAGVGTRVAWAAGVIAALAATLGLIYESHVRAKPRLTTNDKILLGDFGNSTGDTVFDDTLKQALSVILTQSPYLNILSDAKVRATLGLMTKPPDTRLTEDLAREVCQRARGKAYISGSIARLGTEYVVGLNAIDCASGDAIAREQVKAEKKEGVLNALDDAGSKLRQRLGESLQTVKEYDTPLSEATTPSLKALKAYSQGLQKSLVNDAAAVPFFRRALELDAEFASAYAGLAVCYRNLGESGLAQENFRKAFELRGHVSEREKLLISARYYNHVTGELQKAIDAYQLWVQVYPRDVAAHSNLGSLYGATGQFEKCIEETKASMELDPEFGTNYSNLILAQAALEKLDDARGTFEQMLGRKVEDPIARVNWFGVSFVHGDAAEMEKQMVWSAGKPQGEDNFLAAKSDTEAYLGHEKKAREYSQKAVDSALRNEEKESAAQWRMDEATREAEFGNVAEARADTARGRAMTTSHDTQIMAAVTLARIGDTAEAERLANDLEKKYPLDTLVTQYWIPVIRASVELRKNNLAKAVELLQPAEPYELASPVTWSGLGGPMYPAYLRGEAFLKLGRGVDAAGEFQRIIEHRGFMLACPLGALARLQLGRALAETEDKAKAKAAYEDFFAVWKEADGDIPILKAARGEYAKL